jgi:hypothetical protein
LVQALAALLWGAQVLAHPSPKFCPAARRPLAEQHLVVTAGHALDFHLTDAASPALSRRN